MGELISGRTLAEWKEFARRDDCLDCMVPSDLRLILAALEPAPDLAELVGAMRDLLEAYSQPDREICCSGHECGCRGATVQMQAEHYARVALAKIKEPQHG